MLRWTSRFVTTLCVVIRISVNANMALYHKSGSRNVSELCLLPVFAQIWYTLLDWDWEVSLQDTRSNLLYLLQIPRDIFLESQTVPLDYDHRLKVLHCWITYIWRMFICFLFICLHADNLITTFYVLIYYLFCKFYGKDKNIHDEEDVTTGRYHLFTINSLSIYIWLYIYIRFYT